MTTTLFTDEEFADDLTDYEEYRHKRDYLMEKYPQQVDYISFFGHDENTDGMTFDAVGLCYTKDKEFVKRHIELFNQLQAAKLKAEQNYDYMVGAFVYEMFNHEYGINLQADYDVLSAFGDVNWHENDLNDYFDELEFTDDVRQAYFDAKQKYYQRAEL